MGTRRHSRSLLIGASALVAMAPAGCQRSRPDAFSTLFDGFQPYMVDRIGPEVAPESVDPKAFHDTVSAGNTFEPGCVYFFKKVRKFHNDLLSVKIFPDRLRQIGATVTKAPADGRELFFPFIGPGLYRIEFDYKGHKGYILNKTAYDERLKDMDETVILVYR